MSRRVILPGSTGRRGPVTLFVPRSVDSEPTMVCRVPTSIDETCGKLFYPGQELLFQQHCGRCAKENMEWVQTASIRARLPVFDEKSWDPEIAQHMRGVGERMLAEGRLETKPSERAGF